MANESNTFRRERIRRETAHRYFSKNIQLFDRIISFEQRRSLNLFQKLKDDDNEINAYSWLAEINFGLFFDSFSEIMYFNSNLYERKRPDWILINSSQKIVCEVLRINTDQLNFQEYLNWKTHVKAHNELNPNNPIIGRQDSFIGSSQNFYGHQSKIEKKEEKYGRFCYDQRLPLILCIQGGEQTFLGQQDASDFFNTTPYGLFSTSEGIKRNVTGILFRDFFGQIRFYVNDFCENKLNAENFKQFEHGGV